MPRKKKVLILIIALIFLLPVLLIVAPFLIGGFTTYKILKSVGFSTKVKTYIAVPIILITLFIGSAWTSGFISAFKTSDKKVTDTSHVEINTDTETKAETLRESSPSIQEPVNTTVKSEEEQSEPLNKVIRVMDGDTIELEDGKKVRYIGIDTPETVNPNTTVECYGQESSNKNKELVEGKLVKLEKDVSETDRYGRLLRYVYVNDVFVNDYLVRQGYANASSYPPDIKHQEQFRQAENEARENNRGLWNSCKAPTPTEQKPATQPTTPTTTPPSQSNTGATYTCNCKKTCAQMASCAEAQYQLNTCGCSARDNDHDGIACDAQCQ